MELGKIYDLHNVVGILKATRKLGVFRMHNSIEYTTKQASEKN